jgi:hypothetical protein
MNPEPVLRERAKLAWILLSSVMFWDSVSFISAGSTEPKERSSDRRRRLGLKRNFAAFLCRWAGAIRSR